MRKRKNPALHERPLPLIVLVAVVAVSISAQHKKSSTGAASGGGSIEMALPAVDARRRSNREMVKYTLEPVTVTETGNWYYLSTVIDRRGDLRRFLVVRQPKDLSAERIKLFKEADENGLSFARDYLVYTGTLFHAELLCPISEYRFFESMDLSANGPLPAQRLGPELAEWRTTKDTPWEAVRAKVCK